MLIMKSQRIPFLVPSELKSHLRSKQATKGSHPPARGSSPAFATDNHAVATICRRMAESRRRTPKGKRIGVSASRRVGVSKASKAAFPDADTPIGRHASPADGTFRSRLRMRWHQHIFPYLCRMRRHQDVFAYLRRMGWHQDILFGISPAG
jgi:hypothetical protein